MDQSVSISVKNHDEQEVLGLKIGDKVQLVYALSYNSEHLVGLVGIVTHLYRGLQIISVQYPHDLGEWCMEAKQFRLAPKDPEQCERLQKAEELLRLFADKNNWYIGLGVHWRGPSTVRQPRARANCNKSRPA